jgi:hypothetical protein
VNSNQALLMRRAKIQLVSTAPLEKPRLPYQHSPSIQELPWRQEVVLRAQLTQSWKRWLKKRHVMLRNRLPCLLSASIQTRVSRQQLRVLPDPASVQIHLHRLDRLDTVEVLASLLALAKLQKPRVYLPAPARIRAPSVLQWLDMVNPDSVINIVARKPSPSLKLRLRNLSNPTLLQSTEQAQRHPRLLMSLPTTIFPEQASRSQACIAEHHLLLRPAELVPLVHAPVWDFQIQ